MSKQTIQTGVAIAAATPVIYALVVALVWAERKIEDGRLGKIDRIAKKVARELKNANRAG